MKTIVYFLGAGFSVPAGLPVISNFLFKAKDQYFRDPEKYKHFKEVFDYIDSLSKAKNYTKIDLFNIEEIFSIADIHELLGLKQKKKLEQFIKDVVKYYTPEYIDPRQDNPIAVNAALTVFLGKKSSLYAKYVSFVTSLGNIVFTEGGTKHQPLLGEHISAKHQPSDYCYKVITLNYDTIIEGAIDYLNSNFDADLTIPLAKLHGSVDKTIVPPTWNKKLDGTIEEEWKKAAQWLKEATEIRVLGYSMPITDINIKHLFTSAMVDSDNLQQIDVLCLDPGGTVSERYRNMFTFPRYSFYPIDLDQYLSSFIDRRGAGDQYGYNTQLFQIEDKHKTLLVNWENNKHM